MLATFTPLYGNLGHRKNYVLHEAPVIKPLKPLSCTLLLGCPNSRFFISNLFSVNQSNCFSTEPLHTTLTLVLGIQCIPLLPNTALRVSICTTLILHISISLYCHRSNQKRVGPHAAADFHDQSILSYSKVSPPLSGSLQHSSHLLDSFNPNSKH